MSSEIKVVYEEVESAVNQIKTACQSLTPKGLSPIPGNTLDTVEELTLISQKLEQLLTLYQTVLNGNVQATSKSIEHMKTADKKISDTINRSGR